MKSLIAALILFAATAAIAESWNPSECEDWLKTHPTPHPDCVQVTPTPIRHPEKTATPQPIATPTAVPSTPTPSPDKTPVPTPVTVVPTATPNPWDQECIPCGEADAPTPVVAAPIATSTPIVLAAVAEVAPVTEIPPARPVQVLSAGPTLLPFTGDAIPYVASLLLGFGLTIGGWKLWKP